jgi:hypothetical protein
MEPFSCAWLWGQGADRVIELDAVEFSDFCLADF